MSQTELPFSLKFPPASRTEPRLWVKELAVYSEWNPAKLQRRITLRRGLNILWAEPSETGAGGHAAGKTTFCRFLRYLLGDTNFGSETFRDAFRVKFPNAWIVGEVHLDGTPWVVARFVGISGGTHWSAKGAVFENMFREDHERLTYADFTRELQSTFVSPLPVDKLPGCGKPLDWLYLLASLTRDQEARYDHVLDWRSRYSEAKGIGDVHHADRTLILRAVLGLTQIGELQARRAHAEILRKKAECEALIPILEFGRAKALTAYRTTFNNSEAEILENIVQAEESGWLTEKLRLDRIVDDMRQGDGVGDVLPAERDNILKELGVVAQQLKEIEDDKKRTTLQLAFQEGNLSDEEYRKQLAELPLRADQCGAPIEAAINQRCPVAELLHPNRFSEPALKGIESAVILLKAKLVNLTQSEKDLAERKKSIDLKKAGVEKRIKSAADTYQKNIKTFEKSAQTASEKYSSASHLAKAIAELRSQNEKLVEWQAKQRKSTKAQESLRDKASLPLSELSDIFGSIAGFLLQSDNRGAVRFLTEDVKLDLEYSDLTSTALVTLKIIIFDIAALFASAREAGSHPGFLLHDSPREADLTASIYRRIFEAVKTQEPNDENAPFQYIITTTEPPPEALQVKPWLVHPPFSSSDKSRRFLGETL